MALVGRDPTVRVMSLAVKCGRPPSRDGLIARPRLLKTLQAGRDLPLLLIVAPAGYGKTSLLADWTRQDERHSVWIGLEEWHSDPMALVVDLLHALDEIEPIDRRLIEGFEGTGVNVGDIIPSLSATLEARERAVGIVLDDVHAIDGAPSLQLLSDIAEHLPLGSQLALASRTRPALPLGRLRAHRALLELNATDLAMTRPEAHELLRTAGLEPSPADLAAVLESTEGWSAGLYLAALSCREVGDVGAALRDFAGDDHVVADYLKDEFLSELAHDDIAFLIRTSVARRLCGPLCDALLEGSGSTRILDRLARDLPLIAADRSHDSYRVHRLLHEMLLGELRHEDPDSEIELHRRASDWHARRGYVDSAVDHALAAGDVGRAGELLWANLPAYLADENRDDGGVESERRRALARRLSALSPEQIGASAPLALTAAYGALARGEARQAARWGLIASATLDRESQRAEPVSLYLGAAILEAALAPRGAAVMRRDAARACELAPADSPWRSLCCLLHGVADQLSGERARAREHLQEAVRCSGVATPMVEALCITQLALLTADEGDLEQGVELIERAGVHLQRHHLDTNPTSALVFAVSADLRARQGRMDEAKRDLRLARELLAELGDFIVWYGVEARVALARAFLRLADMSTARALLSEASRLARRVPDAPAFRDWLDEAWGLADRAASSALVGSAALTMAELRILRFLPTHLSLREIGCHLHVSTNTVKTQAHAIYRKLGVSSRSEAVARALEIGLLQR